MSTLGIAHHQRGTFPIIDSDSECARRAARYAARDAAYRAALGLNPEDPLPGNIGQTAGGGRGARAGFEAYYSGGRRRVRTRAA